MPIPHTTAHAIKQTGLPLICGPIIIHARAQNPPLQKHSLNLPNTTHAVPGSYAAPCNATEMPITQQLEAVNKG